MQFLWRYSELIWMPKILDLDVSDGGLLALLNSQWNAIKLVRLSPSGSLVMYDVTECELRTSVGKALRLLTYLLISLQLGQSFYICIIGIMRCYSYLVEYIVLKWSYMLSIWMHTFLMTGQSALRFLFHAITVQLSLRFTLVYSYNFVRICLHIYLTHQYAVIVVLLTK